MEKWLEQESQWYEMYCHDWEVMSSNPSWIELGVRSTSVQSRTWTKNNYMLHICLYIIMLHPTSPYIDNVVFMYAVHL